MAQRETLSALIGEIYDASIDPNLWRPVLQRICGYLRASYGILISEDVSSTKAHVHYTSKDEPEWLERYFRKYMYLNPLLVPALLNAKVGDTFSNATFMTQRQFQATVFYKEWVKPQGYADTIVAVLEKSATTMSFLSALRSTDQGPTNDEAHRRMKLVAPHVRRAIAIGRIVDLNHLHAEALADTLDGFTAAIFLVDEDRRIMYANSHGSAMLEAGEPLRRSDRHLIANEAAADASLADALAACAAGDAAVGTKELSVALISKAGQRYAAHLLPLTSGTRKQAGAAYRAIAAVFIRKAMFELPSPLETISQQYGLTARELSVLLAIVEIGGVPAVSPLLGLSEATIKTYLKSIFQKTGTRRQADLVKLVAGLANPFAAVRQDRRPAIK